MGEVVTLGNVTRLDIPPDRVLEENKGSFEGVVLLGFDHEGEFIAASSYADGATVLWLMELCKLRLLEVNMGEF